MKKDIIVIIIFICIGFFSRLPLIEKYQSHWDGPQYAIGIIQYDLTQETPAPPGYPLYIAAGRFVYTITHDPFYSLLILSALGSGVASGVIFWVGAKMFNRTVGFIAAVLLLSSPTFYYFGLTAYPYGLIPIFILMLAYTVFSIVVKKKYSVFSLGFISAAAIGFRPQESYSILPLFALGLFFLPHRLKVTAIISFIIGFILWFFPYVQISGGFEKLIIIYSSFAKNAAPQASAFYSFSYDVFILRIIRGLFLTLGISIPFLLYYVPKYKAFYKNHKYRRILLFFTVWIVPSLLFNLFIRSEHSGYQMSYLSSLLLMVSYAIWELYKKKIIFLSFLVGILMTFNLFWFFRDRDSEYKLPYSPTSFYYSEIRKNDIKLGSKISFIKEKYDYVSTLIITSPYPWRPIMYHLPAFLIYDIDALTTDDTRYKNIFRKSRKWKYSEQRNNDYFFIVPRGIQKIVFTDDESKTWIRRNKYKTVKLPGNSVITELTVQEGETLKYGYQRIEKNGTK